MNKPTPPQSEQSRLIQTTDDDMFSGPFGHHSPPRQQPKPEDSDKDADMEAALDMHRIALGIDK